MESEAVTAARAELDQAVRKWLRVKAAEEEGPDDEVPPTSDPVMHAWLVVACYTSLELEGMDATANSFEVAQGQPAPFTVGLAEAARGRFAG